MRQSKPPNGLPKEYFSIDDLYSAYRKAKADAFFEREPALHLEFLAYEHDLDAELNALQSRLYRGDWIDDRSVLGGCVFIPKSIKLGAPPSDQFGKTIVTKSVDAWKEQLNNPSKPEVKFRPISIPSVDWLVISALWIAKAGHKLDSCLSNSVCGSRLRRVKYGTYNRQSLGSFAPYAPAYIQWREGGIQTIERELKEDRPVVAFTADLRSFYHSLDPSFLKTESFRDLVNKIFRQKAENTPSKKLELLSENDWHFTSQIADSLRNWSALHQEKLPDGKPLGIPIGPTASRIVANVILLAFDQFIENDFQPLYYGRYVDDLFLVLRPTPEIKSGNDVWERMAKLAKISSADCSLERIQEGSESIWKVDLGYDREAKSKRSRSEIKFSGEKQKTFILEGLEGKALIKIIKRQIRANSSEWRNLPEIPKFEEDIHLNCLIADADATEPSDSLRKADRISIQRLRFALHLRDIEALATDLEPSDWEPIRKDLFEFTRSHLITPPELFTYSQYLPRIFALGVMASKWSASLELVKAIEASFETVEPACPNEWELRSCTSEFMRKLLATLCRSVPRSVHGLNELPAQLTELFDYISERAPTYAGIISTELVPMAKRLLLSDLGVMPLRERIKHRDISDISPVLQFSLPGEFKKQRKIRLLTTFVKKLHIPKTKVPPGMIFPTRPLTPAEIVVIDPELLPPQKAQELAEHVQAIRGTQFTGLSPEKVSEWERWNAEADDAEGRPDVWITATPADNKRVKVCLPCLMVSDQSWIASVAQERDPDLTRYTRLTRVINEAMKMPLSERADYIVLPELSVKSKWFGRFAQKLEKSNISLIAGIEYEHAPFEGIEPNEVVNSVRVSLVTDYPGYRTHLVIAQNKATPALHEESKLFRLRNKTLVPARSHSKKIIRHGDFQFAILICSELTNVDFRSVLRGNVDALFVPQWNRDIEGFSPLVDSSASDLHLFVIQSNNRRYGDCRIRAPYKEAWQRDIVRIKGGIHDFFATGQIDFHELRRFQSCDRSPDGPFKPVPDGFQIHPSRAALPLGYNQQ